MNPHRRGLERERCRMDASSKKEMSNGPFQGREWERASVRAEVVRYEKKWSMTPVQPGGPEEILQRNSGEHVGEGWVSIWPSPPGLNIPSYSLSISRARGRAQGGSMAQGELGFETGSVLLP